MTEEMVRPDDVLGPDQAWCQLWCRGCRRDFVVVGAARPNRRVTPAVEVIPCPYCEEPRRLMLARHMQGPVAGVYRLEEWESEGGPPPSSAPER